MPKDNADNDDNDHIKDGENDDNDHIRMAIISGLRLMVLLHSLADKFSLADEHCGRLPIKTDGYFSRSRC